MPPPENEFPAANLRKRLRGEEEVILGEMVPISTLQNHLHTKRVFSMLKLTKRVIVLLVQLSFSGLIVLTGKQRLDKQIKNRSIRAESGETLTTA